MSTTMRTAVLPQYSRMRCAQRGFTLLEVLLAVAITAAVMVAVSGAFLGTMQARQEVDALSDSTEAGPRILAMMERDLQALWHHDIKGNKVLVGRNMDIAGADADRIDFLCTTDAVGFVLDQQGQAKHPSICEVGYWLKDNREIPGLLELWRREDPMVDDDLLHGGHFQLVCDRIRSLNLTYFDTLGSEAEPITEWDSSRDDKLPRRIKIEVTLERKVASRNQVSGVEVEDLEGVNKKYVRHVVLDRRYPDILKQGIAMVPVVPPRPEASGGGGPAGPGGPGAGARGGKGGDGALAGAGKRVNANGRPGQGSRGDGATRGGETRPPGPPPGGGNRGGLDLGSLFRGAGGNNGGLFGGGRGGGGGGGGGRGGR